MDYKSASQDSPLLDSDEELQSHTDDYSLLPSPGQKHWIRRNIKSICFHFTLVLVNVLFVTTFGQRKAECQPQSLIYSQTGNSQVHGEVYKSSDFSCLAPAHAALELRVQDYHTARNDPNEYMGMTDSADKAWHDLMQHTNIRLTEQDLLKLNRTSVALGDGGYLGMPAVYHELHCLKMIRWATNLDRYGHHFGQRDIEELPVHIEHCIDIVRQTIMCKADTSPITFRWTPNSRVPETDFMTKHECVNWEKMVSWMEQHRVDIYAEGVLTHPLYGVSYPNGHRLIENWDHPKTIPPVAVSEEKQQG